jgi:hypothetical protein
MTGIAIFVKILIGNKTSTPKFPFPINTLENLSLYAN